MLKIIPEWRRAWRMVSVQCMALALAIEGAWAMIPEDMRASLPPALVKVVTVTLLVVGIAGRLVDQPKVREGSK